MCEETSVQRQLESIRVRISEGGIIDLTEVEEEEHVVRLRESAEKLKNSVELFKKRYQNQAQEVRCLRNATEELESKNIIANILTENCWMQLRNYYFYSGIDYYLFVERAIIIVFYFM